MLRIGLHIFPLVQILCFIGLVSSYSEAPVIAFVLWVLCGLFLNFSLHITVHYFVHFTSKSRWVNRIFELFYSLIIGVPFTYYRMQHLNHHRFNNSIEDLTSTWQSKNGKIVPRTFFKYAFLWFLNNPYPKTVKSAISEGDITIKEVEKVWLESFVLILFYAFLLYLNPWFALMYGGVIYLGWSLIAATNYGQHFPANYGESLGDSYYHKWYNVIFFNNGLHREHHDKPGISYLDLKRDNATEITFPHLFIGFIRRNFE